MKPTAALMKRLTGLCMAAERLQPELRDAMAVLERHRLPEARDAAEWARAALALLARGRAHLLEALLPCGWGEGFWPEVLRCASALARGQEPPEPLQWLPNWPHNRA